MFFSHRFFGVSFLVSYVPLSITFGKDIHLKQINQVESCSIRLEICENTHQGKIPLTHPSQSLSLRNLSRLRPNSHLECNKCKFFS